MKKIKPLGNQVLIKRSEVLQTKNGILLPESAQEKPKQGEVIAVGPGNYDDQGELQTMVVRPGDLVLFGPYAGREVKGEDEDYLLMSEDEILGILIK